MSDDGPADQLLELAVRAAEGAGALLLAHFGAAHHVRTKSTATDPVSEADTAAEALLVETLTTSRPDDGLLGEEGADRVGTTGLRWVLDPLDGTVNYLYGLPGWSVSVACETWEQGGWHGLVGAVHDPLRGETFRAARGRGAFLGEVRLAVNDPVPLDRALVATGFGYAAATRRRQAQVAARVLGEVRDLRRIGSAALDLCMVASGRVDAYYEDSSSRWDWAAGALIVAEAGGVVELLPAPEGAVGVIAAGPGLHGALLALVRAD